MARIIVTGGNGYVGRELVRQLFDEHQVCIIDNGATGASRFGGKEAGRFRFEKQDITNDTIMANLFEEIRPDIVIHLAAIHYIPQCEGDPAGALMTNVVGTATVLRHTPRGSRFVFASSGAIYEPGRTPHAETSPQGPLDIYGLSKLHGEHYVTHFAAKLGLEGVIVRLFNVVGPGETNPHLLPEIVAQLKAGHRTLHLGNLWPQRDYIHVKDAARGFKATALAEGVMPGEVVTVNLGTSKPYSVSEVVEKLRSVSSVSFTVEQEAGRLRAVDRPYLAANTSLIRQRFGWQPQFTIDDAITDLWREPELTAALTARYAS